MKTETLLEGLRFVVERHTVDSPTGPHTYEVLRHPGAAVILPVLADERVVLIWNRRVPVGAELLEVPAGCLEPGEPPATTAARELAEETGYRAGRIEPLVTFYSSPGILSERMHAFLATELTPGETAHEAGEQIRLAQMPLDEALDAIRDGRIVDAKTIVTLLYYERFRRGQESTR
jgi:ADP-ribose pyrophosphatase